MLIFKKYIVIVVLILFFVSCSKQKAEEDLIIQTMETFYKSLNKKDTKEMMSVCSDNMNDFIKKISKDFQNIVEYKKYTITDVEILSNTSVVVVENTDIYGNTCLNTWDLIKINEQWKINNYNFSKALPYNNELNTPKTDDNN